MKITAFNKVNLALLGADMQAALAPVAAKYGLSVKKGTGRFTDRNYTTKLEFNLLNAEGKDTTAEDQFKRLAPILGFRPEDFGKEFLAQNQLFRISGVKPSSRKFPILATRADGKVFKFPKTIVTKLR